MVKKTSVFWPPSCTYDIMTYVTRQRQDDVTYAKMFLSSLVTDTMRRFKKVTGEKRQGVVPTPNGRPRVKAHSWSWVNKLIYFFSDCSWPGSKRVSTSCCRTNPDGSCWPTDRVVFYEGLDTAISGRAGKTIWCNFYEIFAKFIAHFFALFNLNNGRFFSLLCDLSNDIITKSWAAVSRSK